MTDCESLASQFFLLHMMSSLTPAEFSFLFRQEWLVVFGLVNVVYGVCDG
jgi:hypothetical protein